MHRSGDRAVRARHPDLGSPARGRAHGHGQGVRDEGRPVLRRLRPDAVVVPPGETEYGVKAIPLGGFVQDRRMTPQDDDVDPRTSEPRPMWRFPAWKRTVVHVRRLGGHFVLAHRLLICVRRRRPAGCPSCTASPVASEHHDCATQPVDPATGQLVPCAGHATRRARPGRRAACRRRDHRGRRHAGRRDWHELARAHPAQPPGRPGRRTSATASRSPLTGRRRARSSGSTRRPEPKTGAAPSAVDLGVGCSFSYDPVRGRSPATFAFDRHHDRPACSRHVRGDQGSRRRSPRCGRDRPASERDPDTPVSVVGASRIGGELVEPGRAGTSFILLLAALNLFIGVFNLLPLLPLDGGHIAIAWFERVAVRGSTRGSASRRPGPGRLLQADAAHLRRHPGARWRSPC